MRRAPQRPVRRQAQVIVRAEVDDLLAVEVGDGFLLALENAQAKKDALRLHLLDLLLQERKLRTCGAVHEPASRREMFARGKHAREGARTSGDVITRSSAGTLPVRMDRGRGNSRGDGVQA